MPETTRVIQSGGDDPGAVVSTVAGVQPISDQGVARLAGS